MDPDQDFFTQLPFDITRNLFVNYLGARYIAKLSELSSPLQTVCAIDELWRELCRKELRIQLKHLDLPYRYDYIEEDLEAPAFLINPNLPWKNSLQRGSQMTFREFYTRLVYPFRGLLNWLLISRGSEWNDMLSITAKSGLIRGEIWYPADSVAENMKPLPDFTIYIEEASHQVIVRNDFVYFNFVPNERLTRLVTRGKMIDVEKISRPTHAVFGFRSHPHTARRLKKIQDYLTEQKVAWPQSSSLLRRFQGVAYNKLEQMFDGTDVRSKGQLASAKMFFPHNPLTRSANDNGGELQLPNGLYKGKFGTAGVELVTLIWGNLPFTNGITEFFTGFKTASDCSRPSSGYLFLFKLSHQIFCRTDEQDDFFRLAELENGPFAQDEEETELTFYEQPYQLPTGMSKDLSVESEYLSGTCLARFVGRGSMFSPSDDTLYNVPAHLLILSANRFLVLWLGDVRMAIQFESLSSSDRFMSFI